MVLNNAKVGTYSIRDLEHLTGIKAHTLRIWEQRYSFIHPKRTRTNIRFYNEEDLKLILNISLLKEKGYRISRIACLSKEEINEMVLKLTEKTNKYSDQIHFLTLAMVDMNEERFEKIISANILHLGFEKSVIHIIYPFLSRIGILWQTGATHTAQEYFIYNLIRQKLITAIDGQYVENTGQSKRFLLYLPEGEQHELSLLFAHYLIKSRGNSVVYLGVGVPFQQLRAAQKACAPDYVLTILTTALTPHKMQRYIEEVADAFDNTTILVGGNHSMRNRGTNIPENVVLLHDKEELLAYLEEKNLDFPIRSTIK